jgi:hypothetical protein
MLIVLKKSNEKIRLDYSNIEVTEDVVDAERFLYFFDVNIVDKSKLIDKLKAFTKLITYNQANDLMNGNFFVTIFDKKEETITIYRDKSGIKSAYYFKGESGLIIGTNVHDVAKISEIKFFDRNSIYKYIYGDFLFNGETFYEEINEFKRGGEYSFNSLLKLENEKIYTIELSDQENKFTEEENILKLREEIDIAHKDYLCAQNNILLSGGIDSVAMLIALDDLTTKDRINAVSYKVKDTIEDETHYAKNIADYLDIPIEIKEIDPTNKKNYALFEDRILKMNNPYIGMWIFGNFKGTQKEIYYAGQDTRLHTPSVNPIDRIAFNLLNKKNNLIIILIDKLASFFRMLIMLFNYKQNKYLRELYKLSFVFNIEKYVDKYYFRLDQKIFKKLEFPKEVYEELKTYFTIDYNQIKSQRALYNKIVELKWNEQYINDIRYLQDIAKLNNTYMAMPFYLEPIAKFSATIPFKLAIKNMIGRGRFSNKKRIVKKYMLRQALKDKMEDTVYYRAKAVSSTLYLMFNGILGELIREELKNDLDRKESFINDFKLNSFVDRFLKNKEWIVSDEEYLLKIYQIGTLSIYNRKVLSK